MTRYMALYDHLFPLSFDAMPVHRVIVLPFMGNADGGKKVPICRACPPEH